MLTKEYRPNTLDEMAGQDLNKKILKAIIDKPATAPKSLIFGGAFGSGKCVTGDTRVMTEKGYIQIKDLVENPKEGFTEIDIQVKSDKGWEKANAFYYEKNCNVNYIVLDTGRVITGTNEHRIMAVKKGSVSPCMTKMKDLEKGDEVLTYPEICDNEVPSDSYPDMDEIYDLENIFSVCEEDFKKTATQRAMLFLKIAESHSVKNTVPTIRFNSEKDVLNFADLSDSLGRIGYKIMPAIENGKKVFNYIYNPEKYKGSHRNRIIKKDIGKADVYDLTVPDSHRFYANSVLNHNTTSARLLARALNCEAKNNKPCMKCSNCTEPLESSMFYQEYDSSVVGNVDNIRELRDSFSYGTEDGYKVIVFDESHLVSKQASSALLKVIEESPKNTFFVFCTTDIDKMLPTIRSRSIELNFTTVSEDIVVKNLKSIAKNNNLDIPEEDLRLIAVKSKGHMRNAHMLLDQYLMIGREDFLETVKSSRQYFLQFFLSLAKKDRMMMYDAIKRLISFPLADLFVDYQQTVLSLAENMTEVANDEDVLPVVDAFGSDIAKLIKILLSDWVLESFNSDINFQSALLCLFQMYSGQMGKTQITKNNTVVSAHRRR